MLERLVGSLVTTLEPHRVELLVVDNGSDEPATRRYLERLPETLDGGTFERVRVVVDDTPFNYSALNNRAAALADGDFLCLLNDDVEAIGHADWLEAMVRHAREDAIGCVGAKLLYPDDTVQHAGVMLGMGAVAGHPFKGLHRDDPGPADYLRRVQRVSAVTGACLVLRHSVFDDVGGFDERLAVAWNDVDLCLRVGVAGHANLWTPEATLYHHESVSRGTDGRPGRAARRRHAAEVRHMHEKWGDALARDPLLEHRVPTSARRPVRRTEPSPRSSEPTLGRRLTKALARTRTA